MKRTLLLVVSVTVAAIGTGVVGFWALATAGANEDRTTAGASAGTTGRAAPAATPTAAPTTVPPSQNGLAVTIANPGLTAGQWIDVAGTVEGKQAVLLQSHVAVTSVLPDGRVVLALDQKDALKVMTWTSAGGSLIALLRNAADTGTAAAGAGSPASRPTTPAGSDEADAETSAGPASSTTGTPAGTPTGSPTATGTASSST